MVINSKIKQKKEEGVNVVVQCYSTVNSATCRAGRPRKIMWTERQGGKSKGGRR